MRENQLKKTLKSGDVALGTLLWDATGRGVVHTLAQAGMDFVMICMEHSSYSLDTVVKPRRAGACYRHLAHRAYP